MTTPYTLTLIKRAQRRTLPDKLVTQLRHAVDRAEAGERKRQGWTFTGRLTAPEPQQEGDGYTYTARLKFERKARAVPDDVEARQWAALVDIVEDAVRSRDWLVARPNDAQDTPKTTTQDTPEPPTPAPVERSYASAKLPKASAFAHLYERDAQVQIILSAINAALCTDFDDRYHVALHGPPGCGKTEIVRTLKRELGPDAVLEFDATSTTKAGAQKFLLEAASIPPVLIVEEIEKADEGSLRWLLSALDTRAEVRKTTFRGSNARDVKLLCLATVNDVAGFKGLMSGALASRFAHHVYCPRPTREALQKILEREVARVKGDPRWIAPALDYCLDDALIKGTYQKWLKATQPPKTKD